MQLNKKKKTTDILIREMQAHILLNSDFHFILLLVFTVVENFLLESFTVLLFKVTFERLILSNIQPWNCVIRLQGIITKSLNIMPPF